MMKEYSVTITVNLSIEARNEEQAQERADLIADQLAGPPSPPKGFRGKWWPEDWETPAAEVEELG